MAAKQRAATKRPPKQREPAPIVSVHMPVGLVEGPARKWFYIQKLFRDDGADAAIEFLRASLDMGNAPDRGSLSVTSVLSATIDPTITHGKKFKYPRRRASFDALGTILVDLVTENPGISDDAARDALRKLAELGHPVVQEVDGEEVVYRSGGKDRRPIGKKALSSRMTRIRKHLK